MGGPVMADRLAIPKATQRLVLHEAGYKCANPICRTIITLEIHHLEPVSKDGSNEPDNLLPLCPNCHALHHRGTIPLASLLAWKRILLTLNEAFDRSAVDILLALDKLGDGLILTGDGVLNCAALIASSLLTTEMSYGEIGNALTATYHVQLSSKGRAFLSSWKEGKDREAIASC
jgi:hypothetical protein